MFHLFDVRTFKSNLRHCSTSFNILNGCTWQQFIEFIPSTSFNKKRLLKSQHDLVRGNTLHRLQKSSNLQFTSQVEKNIKNRYIFTKLIETQVRSWHLSHTFGIFRFSYWCVLRRVAGWVAEMLLG